MYWPSGVLRPDGLILNLDEEEEESSAWKLASASCTKTAAMFLR